jgi:hypothetical protein
LAFLCVASLAGQAAAGSEPAKQSRQARTDGPAEEADEPKLSEAQQRHLEAYRGRMIDGGLYAPARALIQADANADDAVTLEEWLALAARQDVHWGGGRNDRRKYYAGVFAAYDLDGDGKWTPAEVLKRAEERAEAKIAQRKELLLRFDADRNGRFGPEEERAWFRTQAEARFDTRDANGDGELSAKEVIGEPAPKSPMVLAARKRYLAARDADKDGSISRGEHLAHELGRFRPRGLLRIGPKPTYKAFDAVVAYVRGGRLSDAARRAVAGR